MYKKVLSKVASAGTLALIGYEVGSQDNRKVEVQTPRAEVPVSAMVNGHEDVIIFALAVIIMIVIAIAARIFVKKIAIV